MNYFYKTYQGFYQQYFINNLIQSKEFEAWVIWNYRQIDFNNIFHFCRNPPLLISESIKRNFLLVFSWQKHPDIEYQKIFYLIKCGIVTWASVQC